MEHEKTMVAFFLPSLEPGGTERNVVNLVNSIDKIKYQVVLVLGKKEGDFIREVGQDIQMVSLNATHSLPLFFAIIRFLKKDKPNVFISAFPRINIICMLAKIVCGSRAKVILTEHSVFSMLPVIAKTNFRRLFARLFMPLLARLLYKKAEAIICVSKGIADDLVTIIGESKKIKIIYNPVINDNVYALAREPVDHPWFLDNNIPIIIAVGRLVECKDYPSLLNAFSQVLKQQSARLVILGRGPEEEKLKKLALNLGVSDQVAFLGFVKNPFKYMRRASVFVLSSLQEGFGNVIIEAMACGVPVISTDCPAGPGEIITNGQNGLLVPVGGAEGIANAVVSILKDANLAKALGTKGSERAEFFSVKKSTQEYEHVLEMVK